MATVLLMAAHAGAATRYDGDGVLSSRNELMRWYINRARFAPEMEADRLLLTNNTPSGHPDYDTCEDNQGTNSFGTTTNAWAPWLLSMQPLAPNQRMSTASTKHSRDMAETGKFQHESPSGNYYTLSNTPMQRLTYEGYTNSISGYYENIAYGYYWSSGGYPGYGSYPSNVQEEFFIDSGIDSRGHRKAVLNTLAREIGIGNCRTNIFAAGPEYQTWDYDTEDFGNEGTRCYFTDTLFYDANTNALYTEGEGIGGIEVRLWDGTNQATEFDASQASGNFAVPLSGLIAGHAIQVELCNTNSTQKNISIPFGYNTLGKITLNAGATHVVGLFIAPTSPQNFGFRNLSPGPAMDGITFSPTSTSFIFPSAVRIIYRLDYKNNMMETNWLTVGTLTATGMITTITDPGAATASNRFYRLLLLRE